ncbi:MAG TPA: nucleotidyltransferase [Acidimicrobiales bacterium]|nr:nucleotidyltransferase [Acidimicrobiales bacterium]
MSTHYRSGEEPTEDDIQAALGEVIGILRAAGVPFLLIGGMSAATFARPRVTNDIDVFVRPADARRALDALAADDFEVEETDPTWLYKAWKHGVLVDVIFRSSGDLYLDDDMLARGNEREYLGITAPLVSPEDLVVIKALAAAEHSPRHWYDALAVIGRCELDWDYVLGRARLAGPRRLLSLLLYAESIDLAVPAEVIEELFDVVHPRSVHPPSPSGQASP